MNGYVRIFGPHPDAFEVRHDRTPLAFTARGHRIPADAVRRGSIELEIVSPALTRPPESGDDRVLGMRVTNIGFTCAIFTDRGD